MREKIIYAAIYTLLTAVCALAQTPSTTPALLPSPTPISLAMILTEAEKQTVNYREEFKNLLAIETKTFEEYDREGEIEDQKIVESNFFVYQSAKDEGVSSELRNVIKVDGKLVPDSQARADRFLAEIQKTTTVEKELDKIQDEGLRYDKTIKLSGFTLFEGFVLSDNLRPYFDFKLLGSETYQGNEVYVVSYQQTRKTPFITVNEKATKEKGMKVDFDVSVPGALKKTDKFLRGKLLIDAKTFQIWREERQVAVQTATPIIALDTVLEYQTSEFGILVPKRIYFLENTIRKTSNEGEFTAVKNTQVNFDYSKFRKSDTDVQILDDK